MNDAHLHFLSLSAFAGARIARVLDGPMAGQSPLVRTTGPNGRRITQ